MGIGFGQISENGPDPNRSDQPVEEEEEIKSQENFGIFNFMPSGMKYID